MSSNNFHCYSQSTQIRGAARWVQFPNDAAHASPNFGYSCSALMGFFSFGFCLYIKIKSCNLKSVFCLLHRQIHSGAKGLRNRLLSQSESSASQRQLPASRHETLPNLYFPSISKSHIRLGLHISRGPSTKILINT
jgi:hypothetical protein